MKMYVCKKCGLIVFNELPEVCPVCYAPKKEFMPDENAIKKPSDPKNLNDLEKKHIPVISVKHACGLVGPGCVDANIKVGEITHVMEQKHFVMYIDVYHDYGFIARYQIMPEKLNPVLGIHLKVDKGVLLAVENCNIHGKWSGEAAI